MRSSCSLPSASYGFRVRLFAFVLCSFCISFASPQTAEAQIYYSDNFNGSTGELGSYWYRSNFVQSGGYAYATSPTWTMNPYLNYANIQVVADVMIPTTRSSAQSISILGRAAIQGINGKYVLRGPEAIINCPAQGQCELQLEYQGSTYEGERTYSITPLNLQDNTGIKHWRGRLSLVIENSTVTACVAGICDQVQVNSSMNYAASGGIGIRATQGVYFDAVHAGAIGTALPGTPAQMTPTAWNFTDTFAGPAGLLGAGWLDRDLRKSDGYAWSLYSDRETVYQLRTAKNMSVKVRGFVPLKRSANQTINIFGWTRVVKRADGKAAAQVEHSTEPQAAMICAANSGQSCKFRVSAGRQSQEFTVTLTESNIIKGHAKLDLELIIASGADIMGCANGSCTSVPNAAYGAYTTEYGKAGFGMSQGVYVDEFYAGSPR